MTSSAVVKEAPEKSVAVAAAPLNIPSQVTVAPGETLYAVSRRYGVPIRPLIEANGLQPPYRLQAGQRLTLPHGERHKVAPGDTVYAIAQAYDVDVYELARVNGLRPPYLIKVGEPLLIPEDQPDTTARPATVAVRPKDVKGVQSESLAPPPGGIAVAPPAASPAEPAAAPVARSIAAAAPPHAAPSVPARASSNGFQWPAEGRIVSGFGVKASGLRNDGINIAAPKGTPVLAAENGVVAYVGNELRGFGNLVLIKHADGWISAYAHAGTLDVVKGDQVRRGQRIATVGDTGGVASPQLHFELRKEKRAVDPQKYLARRNS